MQKIKIIFILIVPIVFFLILAGCCEDCTAPDNVTPDLLGWAVGGEIGGDGIILHTEDGGITWEQQQDSLLFDGVHFSDICIIDQNTLIAVGGLKSDGTYSVLKSEDAGETWELSGDHSLENVSYECIFALDENNIWIVGEQGCLYYSSDIAETWTKIEVPTDYQQDLLLRIAAVSTDELWIGTDKHIDGNLNYPRLLHTTDGGANWEVLNVLEDLQVQGTENGHFLGIKTFGNSVWAIGGFGKFVLRSGDNGNTWEDIFQSNSNCDANDLFVLSETEAYMVADYGGIFSTNDGGMHWTEYHANTNTWVVGLAVIDKTNLWITGSPGGWGETSIIMHSSDGGFSWQDQTPQLLLDNSDRSMYKIRFMKDE
ncbi:MAG: hypothetical protein K9N09_02600 [Candidatus Cloacimonetes bacterium]|nr:hypothetical protein [Candidatus Cloacimonadota bacterium]MCF7813117.1 hypothetical protein [Candidatus Cloacimonadota bacterium]MCF7867565.1 hypothetical protein [Candidatus Cloacimonadota bacterium]MCF7883041.1 hypothetical protein [Candidatus Cloacimonadota bacterium]